MFERPNPTQTPEEQIQAKIRQKLGSAQEGDRTVLPELQDILNLNPFIWERCGNLALEAQESWVNLVAGIDLLTRESLIRKLDQMRKEIGGDTPTALEKLFVDRIVLGWLQMSYAERLCAKEKDGTPHRTTLEGRLNGIQKRYLQAIVRLATVRKLLIVRSPLPPIQLATGRKKSQAFRAGSFRLRTGVGAVGVLN